METRALRVLVVDDNQADALLVRQYLCEEFAEAPPQIDHASDVHDALSRLGNGDYDVVLVDYRLGLEDGLSFLHQSRSRGLEVPAILLTGQGDENVAVQAMKAGAVDYLAKSSLQPGTLGSSVRNAVEVFRARQVRERAEEAFRRSEERYRQIVEAAQEGIWVIDAEGTTTYSNRRMAEMLGCSLEEMGGRSVYDFMDEAAHVEARRLMERRRLGVPEQQEFRLRRQDGSELWALMSISPMFQEDGLFAGGLALVVGITERKRAESALQQANQELARTVAELERRTVEASLLSEMDHLLQACVDAEEAYPVLAQTLQRLFPRDPGTLAMVDSSRSLLHAVAVWGSTGPTAATFEPGDCWALRLGRVHVVDDPDTTPLCLHVPRVPSRGYMCVPMMAQGKATGVLNLEFSPEEAGGEAQPRGAAIEHRQALAVRAGEHIALALANISVRETLRNQSIHDPVSGVFNRRYMEEAIERHLYWAARKERSLGIILLDLDRLKPLNDTFGHEAGDAVIRALGEFLQRRVRSGDIICRYGGDEFVVILPESPLEDTCKRAELLRQEIKTLNLKHGGRALGKIHVSLGVAVFPQHGSTGAELLRVADAALFEAKAGGRDRVVVGQAPQAPGSPTKPGGRQGKSSGAYRLRKAARTPGSA